MTGCCFPVCRSLPAGGPAAAPEPRSAGGGAAAFCCAQQRLLRAGGHRLRQRGELVYPFVQHARKKKSPPPAGMWEVTFTRSNVRLFPMKFRSVTKSIVLTGRIHGVCARVGAGGVFLQEAEVVQVSVPLHHLQLIDL